MKSKIKFGITQKLLLSFGLVVGTTLLAAIIAVKSYGVFSISLHKITEVSVPLMSDSMASTQMAIELSSGVAALTSATNQADRAAEFENISALATLLKEKISSEEYSKETSEDIKSVTRLIDSVENSLQSIDALMNTRISAADNTKSLMQDINSIQRTVNSDLLVITGKTRTHFEEYAQNQFEGNSEMIDALLGGTVVQLISALGLQSSVANLETVLLMETLSDSAQDLKYKQQAITEALEVLSDYRAQLPEEVIDNVEQLDRDITEVVNLANFELTSIQYSLESQPAVSPEQRQAYQLSAFSAKTRIFEATSPVVEAGKFLAMLNGEELKYMADVTLPKIIRDGILQLTVLLELRAELNTVAGTLGQALFVDNQANLAPLKAQYDNSHDEIANLLAQTVKIQGLYEVSNQINKLFVLGDDKTGVFYYRAQELISEEAITEAELVVDESRAAIVNELVELVFSSREQVARLGSNADEQIHSSQFMLILVSAASVLTTLLVFWLLISRSLLKRLHQTINALRSLSKGEYDVSVAVSGSDELTDLARTVEVFRKNGIEAQELHKEREEQAEALRVQEREKERQEKQRLAQREQESRHEQEQAKLEEERKQSLELQIRVDRLLDAVSAAANGDLGYPIDTTGDDIAGQMGRALDSHFAQMRTSMLGINNNSVQLRQASDTLAALSNSMSEGSTANADNSSKASKVTDNVDASISSVVSATEHLSTSIKKIVDNTAEAESVATEAFKLAKSTDVTVRKLSDSSAGISSVIKVITSIAEQTNLLALNATIEAARAGEAGKGFAVVAGEVKELAKETASATEQIESRITDIQTDTESAVAAIQSIHDIVTRISEIQSSITLAVGDQENFTKNISDSVTQTASASETISVLIKDVATRAKNSEKTSNDVKLAAHELSDMAAELQLLVSQFQPSEHKTRDLRKAA